MNISLKISLVALETFMLYGRKPRISKNKKKEVFKKRTCLFLVSPVTVFSLRKDFLREILSPLLSNI